MSAIAPTDRTRPQRKIATRVRNIHILVLSLTFILVAAVTATVVIGTTNDATANLARFYSIEAMGRFNFLLNQDLVLVRKVSHSAAVTGWFADEGNPAKKAAAYNEMMDYTSTLPTAHLYFGIQEEASEFSVDGKTSFDDFRPFDLIVRDDPDDAWYFECVDSEYEYLLNIDIDKATKIPSVWINHKVMKDNKLVGVFCAGIPFAEMARILFARYDNKDVTGYIINNKGFIQMDSTLSAFHLEEKNTHSIFEVFTGPVFKIEMENYLKNIRGYFDPSAQSMVFRLASDPNRYASIVPISGTDWSVVTSFNGDALYGITSFVLLLIAILCAFIICTLIGSFFMFRLALTPLNHLTKSLSASKFYAGDIYGCDRNDEIGELAQTVQRMRDRLSTYNAELLRAARERERLIRIDQLTDIPNRRSFDERLPLEWGRAVRTGTPISILILDLDHFKNYNDTYGHLQGDKALQAVSKLFMQVLKRSGDLVARWGGEEFAVLLVNTNFHGALDVAEQIREGVESLQIPLDSGATSKMTVSIGVNSLIPTSDNALEDFIRHTDMALYTAKREGRNRICKYDNQKI